MNRKDFIKKLISEHPREVKELLNSYMPMSTLDVPHVATLAIRHPGFAEKLYKIYLSESEFENVEGDEKIGKLNFFQLLQTAQSLKSGLDILKSQTPEEEGYDIDFKTKQEEEEAKRIIGIKKPIFFGGIGIVVLIVVAFIILR